MNVLVTGGAGFIGSHTVDLLLEKGYDVRILDNVQPRVHPRGKPDSLPAEIAFLQGDVSHRADLERALAGVESVFQLAAYQDYLPDFSTFIHVNTESTALLFELIVADSRRYPVQKIVVASSQAVSTPPSIHRIDPPPLAKGRTGVWQKTVSCIRAPVHWSTSVVPTGRFAARPSAR